MLSSPRRPDKTIRIFYSAEYRLRVLRRMSRMACSAGSLLLMVFCLIFVPFGHYDEPENLSYENPSVCPKGADVRQPWLWSKPWTDSAIWVDGLAVGHPVAMQTFGDPARHVHGTDRPICNAFGVP